MEKGILPGQVCKLRVHRTGDHLRIDGTELMHTIAERNDLSGADERTVNDTFT